MYFTLSSLSRFDSAGVSLVFVAVDAGVSLVFVAADAGVSLVVVAVAVSGVLRSCGSVSVASDAGVVAVDAGVSLVFVAAAASGVQRSSDRGERSSPSLARLSFDV
jgi:hypothetical protein